MSRLRLLGGALVAFAAQLPAQQVPDTAFRPVVARPAWPAAAGPRLCLDEGHHNFHTLDFRFQAFGTLARADGLRVAPLRATFSRESLSACDLVVIANAQSSDLPWDQYPSPTPSAFQDAEIAALRTWVEAGGALLLIADHMPLAGAAAALGRAFGFEFRDGFAFRAYTSAADRDAAQAEPTLFRSADSLLRDHPVTRGRSPDERVTQVRSFTGQAMRDLRGGAAPLLVLPANFVSVEPRYAWQFSDTTATHPVGGWLQGATRQVGRGRLAVFGEAAMFSAQVSGPTRRPMGMNAPGAEQNAQFALNVLRWLLGTLPPA